MARTAIPQAVKIQVLTEAGYRCAVPTCRNILALDLHHIVEVNDKGPNEPYNLIALCPTCHALYTRGTISKEAINAWKTMLVALNHVFDQETISNLLFLYKTGKKLNEKARELSSQKSYKNKLKITEKDGGYLTTFSLRHLAAELNPLFITGDGVLKFSHLIASDLADYNMAVKDRVVHFLYYVFLTPKGERIVEAWFSGNRSAVKEALGDLPQE